MDFGQDSRYYLFFTISHSKMGEHYILHYKMTFNLPSTNIISELFPIWEPLNNLDIPFYLIEVIIKVVECGGNNLSFWFIVV